MSRFKNRLFEKMTVPENDAAAVASNPPPTASAPEERRTSPGRVLDAQNRILEAENLRVEAETKLQGALARIQSLEAGGAGGTAIELPTGKLHEVPGRRRYMPPDKYAELRENLRHNPMVNPVVVLPRPDGEWDIWSGHHRWDIHIELGRPTIKCLVAAVESETEATDGAFFANLMQSDLTDFEKYVGIKRFHAGHPEFTQTEVAERSGLSKQQVSKLYAFDRLPAEALAMIEADKSIIGSDTVAELAKLAETGKTARVVEAVKLLAEKRLDQSQALKHARAVEAPKKAAAKPEAFKVRAGKSTWCDVRRVKNVMRIEFRTEEQASAAQEAIRMHLEKMAQDSTQNADH
ncbi:ParB/RepB/Spo0J family partition protein [Cupriavidus numazuensis]|uniref:ParB-like N-terminal domain-containing protein n=1 Tax=Cupriavidus numazuensis TaxID=221992 RepID=A0ABM8TMU9_9BURK|nr:ParB N-terminal domain-containing protein [Cupriavidus numazuensis]CAG2155370.1 hypothetical protein LMG26411_04913 [Cupriavidus numazuensis]